MRRMLNLSRLAPLTLLILTCAAGEATAKAQKPEKIPVAFASWTGPGAGSFKSGVRSALGKDCVIVGRKTARVVLEGVVAADGKGAVLHLTLKSGKTGEIVESRDFHSPRPQPARGLTQKIGRAVVDMAHRAPNDAAEPAAP